MSISLKSSKFRSLALYFLLATTVFFPHPVRAQFDTATVLGTVHDESGAVVSGASVTLTNTATGISASTVTDEYGNLIPERFRDPPAEIPTASSGF